MESYSIGVDLGGINLRGAGIGVPGTIEMKHGLIRQAPNTPGLEDLPIRDEIERKLTGRRHPRERCQRRRAG